MNALASATSNPTEKFEIAGERLNYILDQIEFKKGRGRVVAFFDFLVAADVGLEELNYTTCRSWFADHAPPMKKIDLVFQALTKSYKFQVDVATLKAWWKLGGSTNPYEQESKSEVITQKTRRTEMSRLVSEIAGDQMASIPLEDLVAVIDVLVEFDHHVSTSKKLDERYLVAICDYLLFKNGKLGP